MLFSYHIKSDNRLSPIFIVGSHRIPNDTACGSRNDCTESIKVIHRTETTIAHHEQNVHVLYIFIESRHESLYILHVNQNGKVLTFLINGVRYASTHAVCALGTNLTMGIKEEEADTCVKPMDSANFAICSSWSRKVYE